MPYTARFSKTFLKEEKRLPSEVKSRIVETLKETLMSARVLRFYIFRNIKDVRASKK